MVFFIGALAHLLIYAQTNRHTLQLALCGGGCGGIFMWWYIYIYIGAGRFSVVIYMGLKCEVAAGSWHQLSRYS